MVVTICSGGGGGVVAGIKFVSLFSAVTVIGVVTLLVPKILSAVH